MSSNVPTTSGHMRAATSDEKFSISEITDYLMLSGCPPVEGERLRQMGVTCAVNCIRGIKHELPPGIQYVTIPIEDEESERLYAYIDSVNEVIHRHRKKGGRTLVYCGLGISRSASFCIAYLMRHESLSLHDAYKFVQRRRSIVCPNVGFFRQLLDYERKLSGKKTVKIIEAAPNVFVADVVWLEIHDEVMQKLRMQNERAQQQLEHGKRALEQQLKENDKAEEATAIVQVKT